jgi:hypothetical protein
LCGAAAVCIVAERKKVGVLDAKKEMLDLYDALPISEEFEDVDEGDFYELFDTVS